MTCLIKPPASFRSVVAPCVFLHDSEVSALFAAHQDDKGDFFMRARSDFSAVQNSRGGPEVFTSLDSARLVDASTVTFMDPSEFSNGLVGTMLTLFNPLFSDRLIPTMYHGIEGFMTSGFAQVVQPRSPGFIGIQTSDTLGEGLAHSIFREPFWQVIHQFDSHPGQNIATNEIRVETDPNRVHGTNSTFDMRLDLRDGIEVGGHHGVFDLQVQLAPGAVNVTSMGQQLWDIGSARANGRVESFAQAFDQAELIVLDASQDSLDVLRFMHFGTMTMGIEQQVDARSNRSFDRINFQFGFDDISAL